MIQLTMRPLLPSWPANLGESSPRRHPPHRCNRRPLQLPSCDWYRAGDVPVLAVALDAAAEFDGLDYLSQRMSVLNAQKNVRYHCACAPPAVVDDSYGCRHQCLPILSIRHIQGSSQKDEGQVEKDIR